MIKLLKVYFSKRYLSRWLILFFDMFIVTLTYLIAYILRFNFNLIEVKLFLDIKELLVILPVFLLSFRLVKSYFGILRHSTIEDLARIIFSLSIGSSIAAVY